jgi:hypothetical protein
MPEIILTDRLHKGLITGSGEHYFLSMRKLSPKEVLFARQTGIRRYYLPSLNEEESEEFFKEFDNFWDQVIKHFGTDHPFWRNVVSSKMQEWERSVAYLALILFTLSKKNDKNLPPIIIVCSSIEEEVCEEWGKSKGWNIYTKPYRALPRWIRLFFQETINTLFFLYMSAVCFYNKWYSPRYKSKTHQNGKHILIVSLLYLNSFKNGRYLDPFFGNLHSEIRGIGYSVTYMCELLDNFRKSVKKIGGCSDVTILIPYSVISWSNLIWLTFKIFFGRLQISRAYFGGCDFSGVLKWNARRFNYFFNFGAEIYYSAIKKICEREQFNRLIHLFEGNVMERACIQAYRKNYPKNKITGYNHTVLYPFNLKLRLTPGEYEKRPDPDIFVSAGSYSKELLQRLGNRNPTRIRHGCSLREMPKITKIIENSPAPDTILIATDGFTSSSVMLDFIFESSHLFLGEKTILRGHPNVPIENLLKECIFPKPEWFEISNGGLMADLVKCSCVIYRQTSIGMQALSNGIPVIHLNIDSPLISDTLFEYNRIGKWTVKNAEELEMAFNEIRKLSSANKKLIQGYALSFINEYFTPPNTARIKDFLT